MSLNYWEFFKLWYDRDFEVRLKMVSLIAGMIGGNNLEIKRNFLEINGFHVVL